MDYYLGIDVGTSGTKTLVMDARGKVLATANAAHADPAAPRPAWSEQDPLDWWRAAVKSVKAVIAKSRIDGRKIAAIGLSGQMHGLVCLGDSVEPLRPAIIWNDQRTAPQAAEIEREAGGKSGLIKLVGNVAMTSFTLTKLLWVRQYEPAVYKRIKHMLLPKDYVRLCLTGEYGGDVSDMSGTLILDQRKRDWSDEIIRLFKLDRSILPRVYESHEVAGTVTPGVARQLGLTPGTPVVAGAGDQPGGAVGNGIVAQGLVSATMGTSGVVFTHSDKYVTDPNGAVQTFCSAVAGQYCMFGCIMAAGGSFQWFRNTLGAAEVALAKKAGVDPYELLTDQAAAAPAGCEGLFFLPYLTGERTPHADPYARGGWMGITARTTRAELVRAVVEGATFAMNDALTAFAQRGVKSREIRLSGGGARSDFWRQLQADIYGSTCATVSTEEGPAYGAAILAAVGAGAYKSVPAACRAIVKTNRTIKPNPANKKLYAKYYAQYRRLYPALKAEFPKMAEL
jgi:xylulokinase